MYYLLEMIRWYMLMMSLAQQQVHGCPRVRNTPQNHLSWSLWINIYTTPSSLCVEDYTMSRSGKLFLPLLLTLLLAFTCWLPLGCPWAPPCCCSSLSSRDGENESNQVQTVAVPTATSPSKHYATLCRQLSWCWLAVCVRLPLLIETFLIELQPHKYVWIYTRTVSC